LGLIFTSQQTYMTAEDVAASNAEERNPTMATKATTAAAASRQQQQRQHYSWMMRRKMGSSSLLTTLLLLAMPAVARGGCSLNGSSRSSIPDGVNAVDTALLRKRHHHHRARRAQELISEQQISSETTTSSIIPEEHAESPEAGPVEEVAFQEVEAPVKAVGADAVIIPESTTVAPPVSSSSSSLTALNATVISYTACQQIDLAISYITSLDLDQSTLQHQHMTFGGTNDNDEKNSTIWDVYLMQIIITPICLLFLLFGSHLLLPASILCSAALGVFMVFHVLAQYVNHHRRFFFPFTMAASTAAGQQQDVLDCHMKLALSVVAAFLTSLIASTCIKFGLFSLGAVAAGGATYLVMDAFPVLDLGGAGGTSNMESKGAADSAVLTMASDLSSFAWLVTVSMGIFGGIFIRAYEQASLEILTAMLGGIGCAYSLHTFVILHGGELDRALVFLLAFTLTVSGWRFQRKRRLARTMRLWNAKNEDLDDDDADEYDLRGARSGGDGVGLYSSVHTNNSLPRLSASSAVISSQPQPSWQQLQQSIDCLHGKLTKDQGNDNNLASLPLEQIEELTRALNALLKDKSSGGSGNKVQEGKEI
jgi:hypothetical protein